MRCPPRRILWVVTSSLALVCFTAVTACDGGTKSSANSSATPSQLPTPTASAPSAPSQRTPSRPATSASAAAAGTNPLFPLTPGFQSVRQGFVNKGNRRLSHRLVFTVTDATKQIDGVRAVAGLDQDFDGGELAEQSLEFFAVDGKGDARYLGSYTETYEGGQFVNATDSWLSGVGGGQSGVLMPAAPRVGTPQFPQAVVPGEGPATAKVVKTDERKCVPFRCFTGVVVMEEAGSELKYYAPGVGGILTVPLSGDPQETEQLINVTNLSAQGLAEISAEVVKLDRHARSVARDVFGQSAPAKRSS